MRQIIKYFAILSVLLLFYFAFFCGSFKVFRDYGSCREKLITKTFFFDKKEIKENAISKYLLKENLQKPEIWTLTSSGNIGFLNIVILNENYRSNLD